MPSRINCLYYCNQLSLSEDDDNTSVLVPNPINVLGHTSGCNDLIQPNKPITDDCPAPMRKQPNVSEVQLSLSDLQDDNTSVFVAEQHSDPEVAPLFQEVVDVKEARNNRMCYYTRNGVLMRKWRPLTASVDQHWRVVHQIVVPNYIVQRY